ncbi:ferric reductase-like transmembrane domain-containing protein [Sedimentitalea todarodis]|uniref:Ferric reductase-like transmembrane domain-containing protein n=1 Tax=Sedimentitalea todarodis TaxID=1631240 RepID=A0ABU3V7R7_9RHOB|nr:ferric reductase-like transmembrane domain-containing protein [Sedimentitalea todarodis]MDU9002229.1 ferric reductase-like transmembrane domain-containing protein [Sedimentitalea todarodis]
MRHVKAVVFWIALAFTIVIPLCVAAQSPLLAWRDPIYIVAGFAGVTAMALLLIQPLLAGGYLPGLSTWRAREAHRVTGGILVGAVVIHIAGLWLTSPPDVVDALLFVSPTPFSDWGVIAMWAIFAAAFLAVLRKRMRPNRWRIGHTACVAIAVTTSVAHAMLVEGTMGLVSKSILCVLVLGAAAKVIADRRAWQRRTRWTR